VPAGPVQVRVYVLVESKIPVFSLPFGFLFPDQSPEAVHEVMFTDVQLRFADKPEAINIGPFEPLAFMSIDD
jgi:hypothetical protein